MARPTLRAVSLVAILGSFLALSVLAAVVAAQGDAGTQDQTPDEVIVLSIVRDGGALAWNQTELSFPAGTNISLIYDSTGAPGPHNILVVDQNGEPLRTGDNVIRAGPEAGAAADSGRYATPVFQLPAGGVTFASTLDPALEGTITATGGDGGAGGAPTGPTRMPDYVITLTSPGANAWNINTLSFPAGAKIALVYNNTGAAAQHNINIWPAGTGSTTIQENGVTIATETLDPPDPVLASATPVFTMQDGLRYVCTIHPTEMVGTLSAGEFTTGGGGAEHITHVGVNFLAHWVGVIAFAVLFIVYGVTFFLFKYNETPFTTDHKDRAVPAGGATPQEYGEPLLTRRSNVIVAGLVLAALAYLLVRIIQKQWWDDIGAGLRGLYNVFFG